MFKQEKPKNAFLQKKHQEKAKVAEQAKQRNMVVRLQKNVRTFLQRKSLLCRQRSMHHIKLLLLMKQKLGDYSEGEVRKFIQQIGMESASSKLYFQTEFVIQNVREQRFKAIALQILNHQQNNRLRHQIIERRQFVSILAGLLEEKNGQAFINSLIAEVRQSSILLKISGDVILSSLLHQFREAKMQVQNSCEFSSEAVLLLIETLHTQNYSFKSVSVSSLGRLLLFYISGIKNSLCTAQMKRTLCYLFQQMLGVGLQTHEQIARRLMKQNQQIINLIEDEEMMMEIEEKLRRNEAMEDFSEDFLTHVRIVMTHPAVLKIFYSGEHLAINNILLKMVNELSVLFQSHRLIFIREIISSDKVLTSLAGSKDPMFQEGLKMRLLAMDDPQFKELAIFSTQQWHRIIKSCVQIADIKIQKLVERFSSQLQQKLLPFKKRNKDQLQLQTIADLLNNLHKKVLRTGKLDPDIFVDYGLSAQLQNFLFGKGARRIELFLKQFPYLFSFESRMGKFKQFVKEDKTHYDRTLFLQQQVDDDLIIAVRRGHQFMDAYEACMTRDLRKKYKIIFFNQQGLEQEGIDGGGIIKEFINRVLKSAFSENYELFMDSPLNEILPNPYSNSVYEYQFVGKLVGKAVYEGINIEQKFAQPFLNLLIGRQNTFEDLQFIDPEIYRNLLSLKNSTEDISCLEQTFTIYDHLPNGQKRYIDLLHPSKPPSSKQVLVTNQNKMDFIMSYSDFKCNKQIQEKTRFFRKGFLKVIKSEWLTMFSNEELNSIISGSNPDFNVEEMKSFTVYKDYHQKDQTILLFWQVVKEMSCEEKSLLLLYITSCSRPPTLGFGSMKPKICINRDEDVDHLPTANTCMNVLRLPNYKNKALLKKKLLYAINSKAGFQFA